MPEIGVDGLAYRPLRDRANGNRAELLKPHGGGFRGLVEVGRRSEVTRAMLHARPIAKSRTPCFAVLATVKPEIAALRELLPMGLGLYREIAAGAGGR